MKHVATAASLALIVLTVPTAAAQTARPIPAPLGHLAHSASCAVLVPGKPDSPGGPAIDAWVYICDSALDAPNDAGTNCASLLANNSDSYPVVAAAGACGFVQFCGRDFQVMLLPADPRYGGFGLQMSGLDATKYLARRVAQASS